MKIHCSQCVIVFLWHIMESILLYSIMPHSCRFRLINGIYFYEYEVTDFSEIVVQFLSSSTVIISKSFLWTYSLCAEPVTPKFVCRSPKPQYLKM